MAQATLRRSGRAACWWRGWTVGTDAGTHPVRVEVLGPLRLVVGTPVDVRGPKRRAVLALLALAEGRAVSVEGFLDALWPTDLPESGRAALHSHVSRLRRHLGSAAARLETLDGGYRLQLGTDELDAGRARALLTTAREQAGRDPAAACVSLRSARALWRGPVLTDLAEVAPIATAAAGFDQLHRDITDLLIRCMVEAEETDGVVGIAAEAVASDPLREPAVLLLMQALTVTGQPAEALRTGYAYRRRLADEAGLDPSPALSEVERAVAGGAAGRSPVRPAATAASAGPLIGRDVQIAALDRLLATERLVTLVGPGGVGKTRIALEVARRAKAATVLLLAPVTDSTMIPHALAAALDLRVSHGEVLRACASLLAAGPALLVIDNCEHVLDGARDTVVALLDSCPQLTVLTTSREPLGLAVEVPSRLAPLPLPDPDADAATLERTPSVAVFLDRAARVRRGFTAGPEDLRVVADIVRGLDGMPLAIELAAGRLSSFSLSDLRDRLDRSLDLLGGGRRSTDVRHRTLRATVQWSYELLSLDEQRLFRNLSVFVDGVDLPTAEDVAHRVCVTGDPGSALAHLVDASMIDAAFEGRTRYRMMETLRAFGLDRLAAAGEHEAATDRLLRWAVELTAWIDITIGSEREAEADAALRRELANLRAAWQLARGEPTLDAAAAMVTALFEASTWRDVVENRAWAEELAEDPALRDHPRAAAVFGAAADAAYHRGDPMQADQLARAGLEVASDPYGRWVCLASLSQADLARGRFAEAVEHALAAAAVATRPAENVGIAVLAATYAGDLDRARVLRERIVTEGASPTMRAFAAYVDGEVEAAAGRGSLAEEHYERAIKLARSSGATFVVGVASVGLLTTRAAADRIVDALRDYREVIDYFAGTGCWTQLWTTLRNLAELLRQLGDTEPARLLDTAADQAPDAPAVGGRTGVRPGSVRVGRSRALDVAHAAMDRNLALPPRRR